MQYDGTQNYSYDPQLNCQNYQEPLENPQFIGNEYDQHNNYIDSNQQNTSNHNYYNSCYDYSGQYTQTQNYNECTQQLPSNNGYYDQYNQSNDTLTKNMQNYPVEYSQNTYYNNLQSTNDVQNNYYYKQGDNYNTSNVNPNNIENYENNFLQDYSKNYQDDNLNSAYNQADVGYKNLAEDSTTSHNKNLDENCKVYETCKLTEEN